MLSQRPRVDGRVKHTLFYSCGRLGIKEILHDYKGKAVCLSVASCYYNLPLV